MPTLLGRAPFVGRDRELTALLERLEAVTQGECSVTLLAGEPGSGKTRLLDEIGVRAASRGMHVLRGGASDAEGMPPYLPFLEALGRYVRSAPLDQLRTQIGPAAAILAEILPEITLRLGELPAAYALPREQARLRLYEAAGELIGAIAATAPVLLLLDDLQWADAASLDLICHIARNQHSARLLILGAYREGEESAALERALTELSRLRVLTTVRLSPLSDSEMALLASGLLGDRLQRTAMRLLHAQSEGNPFFAEELLRGWTESGLLIPEGGQWALVSAGSGSPALLELMLPPTIVGAVRRRLLRLSPATLELLRAAAVIGRTSDAGLLAEVTGGDAEVVEGRLREAVEARLLRATAADTFTFSHDKIRECLYGEVTATARTRLHGAIGRALEARPGEADGQRLAELAFHCTRGGDLVRGADYSYRAAGAALAAYAADEAVTQYRTALELLGPADQRRGDALLSLGEAHLLAGAEGEAAAAFDSARSWFVQAGDLVAAGRAAHGTGRAEWRLEQHAQAEAAFETAVALLEQRSAADLVRVLVDLSSLLALSRGRHDEGRAHAQRALDVARTLGDRRLEAAATRTVGNLVMRGNDLPAGTALLEDALAMAEAAGDAAEAAECLAHLCMANAWAGRTEHLRHIITRWLEAARQCQDPYQLRHVYTQRAGLHYFDGQWHEAERLVDEARAYAERQSSPEPMAFLGAIYGWLAWSRGDYQVAEAHLDKAIAAFRPLGPAVLVWYLGMLGLAQVSLGKRAEAYACMDEVESLIALQPAGSMPAAESLSYVAQTALLLGDRERASRYYPPLLTFRGQLHDFLVDRLLGELALLLGDQAGARAHLAAAESTARREGLHPELARTVMAQGELALVERRADGAAHARELFARAHARFTELAMAGDVARASERLAQYSAPRRGAVRSAFPDGLTEREVEVLRLQATGSTNREIAAALVLSVRTVERHINHIHAKTGARGRADVALYAVRHGLVPASPDV